MSGTGASADDLLEDEVFPPDAAINVVIDVESHGDPLTFTIELATLTGATRNARAERTIEASTSETVIVPVTPPGGIWSPGNWAAQVEVNGERMQGVQFRIAESNTTAQNASTPRPSRTPAPDTTATASSTATETPPPTRIPTNTPPPTPTEVPIDPTTRLVYDDETLYIINITEELQDISGLVFVQEITDDDPQEFEALGWQQGSFRGEGSVYALQPDSCFQIGLNSGTAASTPDACVRLSSWQQANVVERFWLAHEDGPEFFLIMLNDEELIECEIAAGECEFELPESEE
jgi:hypothetical protein